jgi:hypothetical protein
MLLSGALIGFFIISPELLVSYNVYDHGFGESQRWDFIGTIIGTLGGLLAEVTALRFTTKEMLLTTTLVAIIVATAVLLVQWGVSFSFSY